MTTLRTHTKLPAKGQRAIAYQDFMRGDPQIPQESMLLAVPNVRPPEAAMNGKSKRGSLIRWVLIAAVCAAAPTPSMAQVSYPSRAINFIVPLPAGGGPDLVTRIVAERLSAKWGQPVVVENRPGFVLNLGAQAVANAPPDGYTLLSTPPGPLVTNQYFHSNIGFDPRAFVPVSIMVQLPFVLVAHPTVPVSTLPELIAYAKANPDKLNFPSPGVGSPPHLFGEMLKTQAEIRLVHVPYKGLEPALNDLLGGHIELMFHELSSILEHIKAGKLKALGAGSERRLPELPDVPTISEVLPGFVATTWFAVVAPPKTPPEVVANLSQATAEAIQLPEVAERLRVFAYRPVGMSPGESAAFLKQETDRWREVIMAAGLGRT
jgi:tripartite-type tricarboxylate transporter receptor subunit TctC